MRLLPLPLLSVFTTSNAPISAVECTWVPPMSYQAEGPAEAIGSAAGLDNRRVRGDLGRFKELIENRGSESGAWRGDISAGQKKQ